MQRVTCTQTEKVAKWLYPSEKWLCNQFKWLCDERLIAIADARYSSMEIQLALGY
jgi:hypothetical protein